MGQSMTGKTYGDAWEQELMIDKGIAKCFNIWNNRYPAEFEAMRFPNPDYPERAHGYEVIVYTPLCYDLPDKLPYYYQPFTIPVNELCEASLQVLYANKNISSSNRVLSLIKGGVKKNTSFPEFVNLLNNQIKSGDSRFKGFGELDIPGLIGKEEGAFSSLIGKLQQFFREGILSSSECELALPGLLEREVLNQKRYVILNTNFIPNDSLRFFIVVSFVEILENVLEHAKVKYDKVILYINEAGDLFPHPNDPSFKDVHYPMIAWGREKITRIRHKKIELHLDVQSPNYLNPQIRAQGTRIIIHRMRDPSELNNYVSDIDYKLGRKDLNAIRDFPKGVFHEIGYDLAYDGAGRAGFVLPSLRMARHDALTIKELEGIRHRSMQPFKDVLKEEMSKGLSVFEKSLKDIKESNKKQASDKITCRDKVRDFFIDAKPGEYDYKTIARNTGVSFSTLRGVIQDVIIELNLEQVHEGKITLIRKSEDVKKSFIEDDKEVTND